jgi:hypothetical protein
MSRPVLKKPGFFLPAKTLSLAQSAERHTVDVETRVRIPETTR